MKVLIETYRKIPIYFDTDGEIFESSINDSFYGNSSYKGSKSFSAVKKFIDEFIKENEKFEPFVVRRNPSGYNYNPNSRESTVIGIRKAKRFIYKDESGDIKQISDYEENNYIISKPEDNVIFVKLALLYLAVDEANKKLNEAKKGLNFKTLGDFKKELLNEN